MCACSSFEQEMNSGLSINDARALAEVKAE